MSRLPWADRREMGRVRAYWRTSWMAAFGPGRLAAAMNRPVSFRDAQRFRHITVLLAWLPSAAWIAGLWLFGVGMPTADLYRRHMLGWNLQWLVGAVMVLAAWLFLLGASGVASYFFHPRALSLTRQNRAIALSYYACAPLAWLFVPAAMLGAHVWIASSWPDLVGITRTLNAALSVAALCLIVAITLISWVSTIRLMNHTTHRGGGRTFALMIYLPLAFLALGAVTLAIAAAALMGSMMVLSLR